MITTPHMGLALWNLASDHFNKSQHNDNLLKIASHDHTAGRGPQIPTGGLEDGAVTGVKIAAGTITADNVAGDVATQAEIDAHAALTGTAHILPIQTSLPGSPTDGLTVALQSSAMASLGIIWTMRYRSASSRWEFVGGAPMYAEVNTAESTTISNYGDLATVGPTLPLPQNGSYLITMGMTVDDPNLSPPFSSPGSVEMALHINGSVDASTVVTATTNSAVIGEDGTISMSVSRSFFLPTTLAGNIVAKYRTGAAGGAANTRLSKRFIQAVPVQL